MKQPCLITCENNAWSQCDSISPEVSHVTYQGTCSVGSTITITCPVAGNPNALDARLWAGECAAGNCFATRAWQTGIGIIYSNNEIISPSNSKTITITQPDATQIAATCQATQTCSNEQSAWGDSYPLCTVSQCSSGIAIYDVKLNNTPSDQFPTKTFGMANGILVSFSTINAASASAKLSLNNVDYSLTCTNTGSSYSCTADLENINYAGMNDIITPILTITATDSNGCSVSSSNLFKVNDQCSFKTTHLGPGSDCVNGVCTNGNHFAISSRLIGNCKGTYEIQVDANSLEAASGEDNKMTGKVIDDLNPEAGNELNKQGTPTNPFDDNHCNIEQNPSVADMSGIRTAEFNVLLTPFNYPSTNANTIHITNDCAGKTITARDSGLYKVSYQNEQGSQLNAAIIGYVRSSTWIAGDNTVTGSVNLFDTRTKMKCGDVSMDKEPPYSNKIQPPSCTIPKTNNGKVCPSTNCVYADETTGANPTCYLLAQTILNKNGKTISCQDDNYWCPENFIYDTDYYICRRLFTTCAEGFTNNLDHHCEYIVDKTKIPILNIDCLSNNQINRNILASATYKYKYYCGLDQEWGTVAPNIYQIYQWKGIHVK